MDLLVSIHVTEYRSIIYRIQQYLNILIKLSVNIIAE